MPMTVLPGIGDTRALFKDGRCGLLVEWGDPGPLQLDDDATAIKGKLYAISAIGSREVLDRATGKLVPVTKANAPHSIDGVNYAPFAAFGGWAGAVNKKADQKTKSLKAPPLPVGLDLERFGLNGHSAKLASVLTNFW